MVKKEDSPYFRVVKAHPNGAIVHHGDCAIHSISKICDCGLLNWLRPLENARELFSNYSNDEIQHQKSLHILDDYYLTKLGY